MDKQKLHKNHPQALGSGPWLFSHCTSPQAILVMSGPRHQSKNETAKLFFFTMAATISTTLRAYFLVSFSFKVFSLEVCLKISYEEVDKVE